MLGNLNLQKIVLIVAIVSLIFAVIIIYYKSLKATKNIRLPRVTTKCPDYWDLSSDRNVCVNTNGMNKGALSYKVCNAKRNNYSCCTEGTCYIKTIETNKKGWARKNKFVWDGIYNG